MILVMITLMEKGTYKNCYFYYWYDVLLLLSLLFIITSTYGSDQFDLCINSAPHLNQFQYSQIDKLLLF